MSKKSSTKKLKKVVMVSGGFDPVHIGHLDMFREAKKLGDELVVVVNNDNWYSIKGRVPFMNENDRKEIIKAFKPVDRVVLTKHKFSKKIFDRNTLEYSVCEAIEEVRPDIFANGGDRFADDIPEFKLCKKLGIKMVFNVGKRGKIRSSSDLIKKAVKNHKLKNRK